jgi:hypothetical protein
VITVSYKKHGSPYKKGSRYFCSKHKKIKIFSKKRPGVRWRRIVFGRAVAYNGSTNFISIGGQKYEKSA